MRYAFGETLLVLQYWKSGYTLDEIARRVDRSRETVMRRITYALRLNREEVLQIDAVNPTRPKGRSLCPKLG